MARPPVFLFSILGMGAGPSKLGKLAREKWKLGKVETCLKAFNPGPAGPVSIRIRYACLCGGLRIYPGSPGK